MARTFVEAIDYTEKCHISQAHHAAIHVQGTGSPSRVLKSKHFPLFHQGAPVGVENHCKS
jgi:hypothetical protein